MFWWEHDVIYAVEIFFILISTVQTIVSYCDSHIMLEKYSI